MQEERTANNSVTHQLDTMDLWYVRQQSYSRPGLMMMMMIMMTHMILLFSLSPPYAALRIMV